ncbi:MAG: hypothetical protein ACI4LH_03000 [Candidatus Heritagella sp.]
MTAAKQKLRPLPHGGLRSLIEIYGSKLKAAPAIEIYGSKLKAAPAIEIYGSKLKFALAN